MFDKLKKLLESGVSAINPFDNERPAGKNPAAAILAQPTRQSTYSLTAPHVAGAMAVENAADELGYTEPFRRLVQGTLPRVVESSTMGAAGTFHPDSNEIRLNPDSTDVRTVTHEGLHAAYQQKSPGQRQEFLNVANNALGAEKKGVNQRLSHRLYGGQKPLTEVHSFLAENTRPGSPAANYYKQYYSAKNQFIPEMRAGMIRRAVGNPYERKFTPQFSDWME